MTDRDSVAATIISLACAERDYSDAGYKRFMYLMKRLLKWLKETKENEK